MFSFFESLASIFNIVVDFILDLVFTLVSLLVIASKFFMVLFLFLEYLPGFLLPAASIIIPVVVIYHVINRG